VIYGSRNEAHGESHGIATGPLRVRAPQIYPDLQGGPMTASKLIRLEDVDRAGMFITLEHTWRKRRRQE